MNSPVFKPLSNFLTACHDKKMYPGAVAAVFQNDRSLFELCVGNMEPQVKSPEVRNNTIFDVASLTKPVATATSVFILHEQGKINIWSPASNYLEELQTEDKCQISIFHLLTHTSGLPAWKPLYLYGTPDQFISIIANLNLEYSPGSYVIYSCLGFILLAEIIRRITSETLSTFTRKNIFDPLDMKDTFFNPPLDLKHQIAPTELGNGYEKLLAGDAAVSYGLWRDHRLHGEVQDGNSFTLNGEGGNAGLFSCLPDLHRFAQMVLNKGIANDRRILSPQTIADATRNFTEDLNLARGLGWQIATKSPSAGKRMNPSSFGHNGFTGVSLWIDPVDRLIFILLTNRAYYGGNGYEFSSVRGIFHDIAMECFKHL